MEAVVSSPRSNDERDFEAGYQCNNEGKYFDYSQRAQWLRAVVLGGNEGVVSTSIFIMGLGTSLHHPTNAWVITGLIGLFAGALRMAVAEFVSVYTQVDITMSQNERDVRLGKVGGRERAAPPSPTQIAVAASLGYVIAGVLPLVAAMTVKEQKVRFYVTAVSASLSMLVLGKFGALMGKAPLARSCARVIIGGWIEIALLLGTREVLQVYQH